MYVGIRDIFCEKTPALTEDEKNCEKRRNNNFRNFRKIPSEPSEICTEMVLTTICVIKKYICMYSLSYKLLRHNTCN